jgi:hypothetical protein
VIVAAASCPHPPLLLPGATGRAIPEVESLRTACLTAIGTIMAAQPDVVKIIGGLQPTDSDPPQSIAVGLALLAAAGCSLPVEPVPVAMSLAPADCEAQGTELDDGVRRVGLLVMADGSARRGVKAPGHLDARAVPFDDAVTAALTDADWGRIAELNAAVAADLLVAGRAAWQVLAAASRCNGVPAWRSTLHYADGPFGVWYPVLSYSPA